VGGSTTPFPVRGTAVNPGFPSPSASMIWVPGANDQADVGHAAAGSGSVRPMGADTGLKTSMAPLSQPLAVAWTSNFGIDGAVQTAAGNVICTLLPPATSVPGPLSVMGGSVVPHVCAFPPSMRLGALPETVRLANIQMSTVPDPWLVEVVPGQVTAIVTCAASTKLATWGQVPPPEPLDPIVPEVVDPLEFPVLDPLIPILELPDAELLLPDVELPPPEAEPVPLEGEPPPPDPEATLPDVEPMLEPAVLIVDPPPSVCEPRSTCELLDPPQVVVRPANVPRAIRAETDPMCNPSR